MGRGRGRGRGRGGGATRRDIHQRRDPTWQQDADGGGGRRADGGGDAPPPSNADFEDYYRAQRIVPDGEWPAFMDALRRPLPMTFRVNGGGKYAADLRARLEADFLATFSPAGGAPLALDDGAPLEPPRVLPWYPGRLAWQADFSRATLRRAPALGPLHEFIKAATEVGAITRQEAVSMVPPLFLGVQPHHAVLDMCAAPGSKTAQLLEALHDGGGGGPLAVPPGFVLANDADAKRCNLLTHQCKRMASPALLVANHEAQFLPAVRAARGSAAAAAGEPTVLFDRVLADVPCSGDGTLRKQPDIWRRWSPAAGNGLHALQVRIALRGAELARPGGRLVYSTCTFNPVEDEAVVAEVLRRCGGALELLDVAGEVPDLVRLPGLRRWRVRDGAAWHDAWGEAAAAGKGLAPSMFPGGGDAAAATADGADALPLERCMRFLPHHQDTGGFFVAVLRKVRPLGRVECPNPAMQRRATLAAAAAARKAAEAAAAEAGAAAAAPAEAAAPAAEAAPAPEAALAAEAVPAAAEPAAPAAAAAAAAAPAAPAAAPAAAAAANGAPAAAAAAGGADAEPADMPEWGARGGGGRGREGGGGRWAGVDPIVPFTDAGEIAAIAAFYGLPEGCPVTAALLARNAEARPKKLSFVTAAARELLQLDAREALKVTSAGLKVFERQAPREGVLACVYRVAQEGLPVLLPYVTKQRLELASADLLALLEERMVGLPEGAKVHITKQQQPKPAPAAEQAKPEGGEQAKPEAMEGANAEEEGAGSGGDEPPAKRPKSEEGGGDGTDADGKPKGGLRTTLGVDAAALAPIAFGCCVVTLAAAEAAALGLAVDGPAPLAVAAWRGRGSINVLASRGECGQFAGVLRAALARAGAPAPARAERGAGAAP